LDDAKEPRKARPRYRPKIFYDILCSIIRQESNGVVRITRVQNEVNLPSDRLRTHLEDMKTLELVEYGDRLASTEKGRTFVSEYEKVADVLKKFGLD
jgi:predicted transcriptional regulator